MPGHRLDLIMRSAMRGAGGDFALVAMRADDTRLIIQAGVGQLAENMVGSLMLVRDSVAASVILTGEPMLVADYPTRGGAVPDVRAQIGSVIVVPMVADERIEGALSVGRLIGRPSFGRAELDDLGDFVDRTGAGRELQTAREERRTARLVEERGRIRDDLHDNVIQELFAAGMALQAAAGRIPDRDVRELVNAQVDALDGTTARIRSLINDMPSSGLDGPLLPLTKRLIAIVDSFTPALRCLPTVAFAGAVEASVDSDLAEDLEAVLREALSNAARHAHASAVQVRVAVVGRTLALTVTDDGRGVGSPVRSSGLTNMQRRAARHNGNLQIADASEGGTELRWTAEVSGAF